jgi:hypothetical protein
MAISLHIGSARTWSSGNAFLHAERFSETEAAPAGHCAKQSCRNDTETQGNLGLLALGSVCSG